MLTYLCGPIVTINIQVNIVSIHTKLKLNKSFFPLKLIHKDRKARSAFLNTLALSKITLKTLLLPQYEPSLLFLLSGAKASDGKSETEYYNLIKMQTLLLANASDEDKGQAQDKFVFVE